MLYISKEEVRKKILSIRDSLDPAEAKQKSCLIFSNLKKLRIFNDARVIHTYVSSKKNEVDTIEIIDYLLSQGKRVIVPIIDKERKILQHSELNSLLELERSTFGILEPRQIRNVNIKEIEIVLVPAVAVDKTGNRVGLGGGYYDRFLRQINCPKIALVYDFQVVDEIEVLPNDSPVDFIVTETKILECRRSNMLKVNV